MTVLTPRPAATVLLLRDRATIASGDSPALEVLMLKKTTRVDFASGAYVFPGGAVDSADAELAEWCVGGEVASDLFGEGASSIGYFVAAVREAFEESGVLLARSASGEFVDSATADEWRRAVESGGVTFNELIVSEKLTIDVEDLVYFSHWITPVGPPRRYDTRFFFARMPPGQTARHEGGEVVDTMWTTPAAAVEKARRKEIDLVFATLKTLELMSRFSSVADVEAWAERLEVGVVEPRVRMSEAGVEILVPGDEGYEEADSL